MRSKLVSQLASLPVDSSNPIIGLPANPHTKKGLTLVEALVAVSIFAIIGGAIVAAFSKGMQVWEDARIRTTFREEPLIFLDGLEKELKNYISFYDSKFEVEEDRIDFSTLTVTEDIYNMRYVLDKSTGNIYRHKAQYPILAVSAKPVLMLKNVKNLKFTYQQEKIEDDLEKEAIELKFPKMVRVNLTVRDESAHNEYQLQRTINIPVLQ